MGKKREIKKTLRIDKARERKKAEDCSVVVEELIESGEAQGYPAIADELKARCKKRS